MVVFSIITASKLTQTLSLTSLNFSTTFAQCVRYFGTFLGGVNKITSVSAVSVIASMVEVSDARNLKANNAHKESTIKEFEKANKSELFYSRTNVSTSGHRKKGITRSGRRSGSSSTDGNVVHGKSMLIESDGEQSKSGPAAEV